MARSSTTQSVDVASQPPCSYFLAECENISTDWCSLEPRAEALPLTLRQWTVATVSSTCQQPLFPWVVADYPAFFLYKCYGHATVRVVVTGMYSLS